MLRVPYGNSAGCEHVITRETRFLDARGMGAA
jgi:hypothetical protein